MNARLAVILAAIAAVAVAAVVSSGGGGDGGSSGGAPSGALRVSFIYSPEKEQLLKPVINDFNGSGTEVGGRKVFIEGEVRSSGEVQTLIAHDRLHPVLWSPSSSFWGRLLNYEADQPLAADENPSIVRTPLVIAMWEQLSHAYGYPKRPLSYRALGRLATNGWAAVGRPQFGAFKYVHTNPDFSTSGLSAVAASYYAAAGKKEGLTVADVERPAVRSQVAAIERSIVHYGDTTLFIADEMRRHGLGYASAVAMEEATLLDFNKTAPRGRRLVAVFPTEGTFYSDNPLITLHGSWVSADQRQAAKQFASFVAKRIDAGRAGRYGFRPADPAAKPGPQISRAAGTDPSQPRRVLRLPEPKVLAHIKTAWRTSRKPANVMLVVDNSGSMGEENKLEEAKKGLRVFLREVAPQDRIGLTKFAGQVHQLVPVRAMRTNRGPLLNAIGDLFPEDDTGLYDATLSGVEAVQNALDRNAINAVVVLTDGQDTTSTSRPDTVVARLSKEAEKETGQIRVFTIAYGKEPDEKVLQRFAQASGGKAFAASTDDIEKVYLSISSFF